MALLGTDFVTSFAEVQAVEYDPIPEGDYILRVSETDIKDTKDGTGKYVKVVFDVVAPSHQGRKIFANFNIFNSSADAERIGKQQLKSLVIAGKVQEPLRDTDQLVGATVRAKVAIKPAEGQFDAQNVIKSYKPADSAPIISSMPAAGGSFSNAFKPAAPTASAPMQKAAGEEYQPWKQGGF